ncbi:uncharacterized protein si:dkey-262k9.2 isoform X2 [Polyodon spathula]|nr:uncharacterized protein si:dkey-262k9.2 isoform X2 [Polyodon spathula]
MLRILILCVLLRAAASLETEGYSGDFSDDEDLQEVYVKDVLKTQREPSTDAQSSPSSWIIPVAVAAGLAGLTALVIGSIQFLWSNPKKRQSDCSSGQEAQSTGVGANAACVSGQSASLGSCLQIPCF